MLCTHVVGESENIKSSEFSYELREAIKTYESKDAASDFILQIQELMAFDFTSWHRRSCALETSDDQRGQLQPGRDTTGEAREIKSK